MSGKQIVRELNSGIAWLRSQAGSVVDRAGRDRVENLIVTALIVLSTSPNWHNYRQRIRRDGWARGIRKRREVYTTKRWARAFGKLLRLAVSDLECLPSRSVPGTPLGGNSSPAQMRQRAAAIRSRWSEFRIPVTSDTPGYETENLSLQNKGFEDPRIATFGKAVVLGNERSEGFSEVTT